MQDSINYYNKFVNYKGFYESRLAKTINWPETGLENKIKFDIKLCVQLLLRRSNTIYSAISTSVDMENFISLVLATRAHIEVTGSIGYLVNKLENYDDSKIKKDELIEVLDTMKYGSRSKKVKSTYSSINVLTQINDTDKLINEEMSYENNILIQCYDILSEFCHPNFLGLFYSINDVSKKQVSFCEYPFIEKKYHIINQAVVSLSVFFDLYDYLLNKTDA